MITQSYRQGVRGGVNLIPAGFRALLIVLLSGVLVVAGCGDSSTESSTHTENSGDVRVVSLSPAITRTLVDLGMDDLLVGRTPWCSSVDASIPAVGDLYDIDLEALIRLQPTHLLIQPPRDGVRSDLRAIAEERGWVVRTWSLNDVDDIRRLVAELPAVLPDGERAQAARARAVEIEREIERVIRPSTALFWTDSTLLLAGTDPVLAYGRGSYLSEIMMDGFGVPNAVPSEGWPELSLEDVQRLNPTAIIVVKGAEHADLDPMEAIGPIRELDIAAVRDERVVILSSDDAELPSSAVRLVAGDLHRALVKLMDMAPELSE